MDQDQPQTTARPSGGKFIAVFSLLLALIAIISVFCLWQHAKTTQLRQQATLMIMQKNLAQSQLQLTQQQQLLQTLVQQNQRRSEDWLLLEADYLIHQAEFKLAFEKNILTARQLLMAADQRLQASGKEIFWPVRQILAKDIATLNAASLVDLPGILSRLGALSQQAEQLPQIPVAMPQPQVEASVSLPVAGQSTWAVYWDKTKRLVSSIGQVLANMVVITHDQSKVAPSLLTSDQRWYLVTNIQSKLDLAQWAAIHQQEAIYQQSLLQVNAWLMRYFSSENALVQSLLKEVDALKDVNISPIIPDISHSLAAISQAKSQ